MARILYAEAQLTEQPTLGRPRRVADTRELVIANTRYLVPDRVCGDSVEILRVFHTLRHLPRQW
ncbi:MAG: type II toxin-antitoxin system RelE/ParE family toxin [Burkholderiales bacterium]